MNEDQFERLTLLLGDISEKLEDCANALSRIANLLEQTTQDNGRLGRTLQVVDIARPDAV